MRHREQGYRQVEGSANTHVESRHLKHGVVQVGELDQMRQLCVHDLRAPDGPTEASLIQNHEDERRRLPLENRLAFSDQADPLVGLFSGDRTSFHHALRQGLGVLLRLQQTGHDAHLVQPDLCRAPLVADELREAFEQAPLLHLSPLALEGLFRARRAENSV
ncbi:putative DNA-binding protein [Streptomyces sp. FR-008]|nr:putative DNA-binding protein [Streptomyces sp. FR-008]